MKQVLRVVDIDLATMVLHLVSMDKRGQIIVCQRFRHGEVTNRRPNSFGERSGCTYAAGQYIASAYPASAIPHEVEDSLCKVNPSYARILFHWTRLVLFGMISPDPKIILAHRSCSAKVGHYIKTIVRACAILDLAGAPAIASYHVALPEVQEVSRILR